MNKRALPNDKPLGEPVRKFEDTFSAFNVVKEHFKLNAPVAQLAEVPDLESGGCRFESD